MTLHQHESEVGVRDLHNRLSEYLEKVEKGGDVIVTRRGKRIARLSALDAEGPLGDLSRRGLIRMPLVARASRSARVKGDGPISDLVAEQRR